MKPKAYILIVEDEAILYERLRITLTKEFYEIAEYTPSYEKAIERLNEKRPDIVLLDIDLQGEKTGLDLGKVLYEKHHIPFIYVTGFDDAETFHRGLATSHEHFFVKTKPTINEQELVRCIQTVLNRNKETFSDKEGVLGLKDYLEDLKNASYKEISRVPVKFEDIAFFTNNINEENNHKPEKVRTNYIRFVYSENKSFYLKSSLTQLLKVLPDSFIRINESYIVNLAVQHFNGRINGRRLSINGVQFDISETYLTAVKIKIEQLYY